MFIGLHALIILRDTNKIYRLHKTEIRLEPYLLVVKNSVTKIFLSRFRLSPHNLYMETGRWQRPKIPPEDRICPSCKNGVEDEILVFAQCQRYNDLRVPFFIRSVCYLMILKISVTIRSLFSLCSALVGTLVNAMILSQRVHLKCMFIFSLYTYFEIVMLIVIFVRL